MRVPNSIPLGCPLHLTVRTFYDVTILKTHTSGMQTPEQSRMRDPLNRHSASGGGHGAACNITMSPAYRGKIQLDRDQSFVDRGPVLTLTLTLT
jgi:hypothetical protein